MISLTYFSTAVEPLDERQLAGLLRASRRDNLAAGLTGMLLYADGHFVQTLEGPEPVVDDTFARIAADPRHRDVFVALRELVTHRAFPDWSMGYDRLEPDSVARIPGLNDFMAALTDADRDAVHLGRAGVFHRIFRDRMR